MRRRVAFSRDTLQAHRLPSTEYMELNYRPALAEPAATATAALSVVSIVVILFVLLLWAVGWVASIVGFGLNLLAGLLIGLALLLHTAIDPKQRFSWRLLGRNAGYATLLMGVIYSAAISIHTTVYIAALGTALLAGVVLSYLMAKQFAFWTTANPRVGWRATRDWKRVWRKILWGDLPPECPEALTFRLSLLVLLLQFCVGYAVLWGSGSSASGLLALASVFVPLPVYWIAWNLLGVVPRLPLGLTIRATFVMLGVWFGYLPSDQGAAGLFRFPDSWLRDNATRFFFSVLVVSMLAIATMLINDPVQSASPAAVVNQVAEALLGPLGDTPASFERQLFAGAIAASLPIAMFVALVWFVTGSVATRYWLALEQPGGYAQSTDKSPWAISVDRILNSRDSLEQKHLLLGHALFGDYPILLHRDLLHQHAHLVGDSGSRKTSLGIAPLLAQLIAGRKASVMILDLKGDRALFETARLEANHARADFRWFTTEIDQSSHVFNPLDQEHFDRLTPNQQTQLIMEGLALDYGDAYGRGFFSAMNETVLLKLLQNYSIRSFAELHRFLLDPHANERVGNTKDDLKNAKHLVALVARLASISPFNVTKSQLADRPIARDASIDVGQSMSRSQVLYFNLRSPAEPIGSPAIAKMAMYSLFAAAAQRLSHQNHQVYVIVDEFQQVVSDNIRLVLEQARSCKISFIIAHQAMGQLDRKGIDIRDTVSACTAFKQFFRASDPDTIRHLEQMSGEAMYESLSWRQQIDPQLGADHDLSFSPEKAEEQLVMVHETTGTRLERNTIIDISATANTSLISVTEGSGYTQFSGYVTPIISDYHITPDEYDKRNRAPWPSPNDETVVVSRPVPSPPTKNSSGTGESEDASEADILSFEARLRGLHNP